MALLCAQVTVEMGKAMTAIHAGRSDAGEGRVCALDDHVVAELTGEVRRR
jgi:hypothetical protein